MYGTLLHNFGYKKVYAMSARQLVSKDKVAVYEQQRAFRAERAEVIAHEKGKSGSFSIPGVISIAEGTANVRNGAKVGLHRCCPPRVIQRILPPGFLFRR